MSDFEEALKNAARILSHSQPMQVITHSDVDGIAAGALAQSALDCTLIIQNRLSLETISPSQYTLFLDLGSSQLQEIHDTFDRYLIIDHHPSPEYNYQTMVNPWMYDIDGTRTLCAAATFYRVLKHMDPQYISLSYLGIVGALGDRQPLTGENETLVEDAHTARILSNTTLFDQYDLHEFVDIVNACCRNGKKELALKVCLLQEVEKGRKELETYNTIFQKDLSYLEENWSAINQENARRSALFIYSEKITQKYAGELATILARNHDTIIILMAPDADSQGVKISGRATPSLIERGLHLGEAFSGYGGGHDIAAGAFLESSSMIETFIQVVNKRIHYMMTPITVTLDIPVPDAEKVLKALSIDNEGYQEIQIRAENNHILGDISGPPGTVKNTTDDIIACIISAIHMMEEE